jgi:hypothetical protein
VVEHLLSKHKYQQEEGGGEGGRGGGGGDNIIQIAKRGF